MSASSGQAVLATAVLDPDRAPTGLDSWNGSDPVQRFAVHRNNVIASLIAALADTFPVVEALVGRDFFRGLAGEFVRGSLPASPVLAWYGAGFPDFIADFEPAARVPYLADVARLEYARVLAFHAADATPVSAGVLADLLADPARLPHLRVRLAPSTFLLRSDWAIVSLWAAHQGLCELATVVPQVAESALVSRRGLDVEIRRLTRGDVAFVAGLIAGQTLGAAVGTACRTPGFDLTAAIGLLLTAEVITSLTAEQGDKP